MHGGRLAAFNQCLPLNEESHPAVTLLTFVLRAYIKRASMHSLAPSNGHEAHCKKCCCRLPVFESHMCFAAAVASDIKKKKHILDQIDVAG